ncbi:MAG: zinc ABC transporter substrate-binding protein [Crocinitomicaceae bacterium]
MRNQILQIKYTVLAHMLILFALFSCRYNSREWSDKKLVVATTGMIGDALYNILPADYKIHTLMGVGVDPHTYEARPNDINELAKAQTIVYNGLHLEGKMANLFVKLARDKNVIAISDGLPENKLIRHNGLMHDPHIWLDPFLWAIGIDQMGTQLALNYPEDSTEILMNTKKYVEQILETARWMQTQVELIPKKQRVLITSHDAFHYFGKSFQVQVDALQGISTVSEPGIRTVSSLMNRIVANQIPAVFIESSVPKKSIQALKEACARKGYTLNEGGMLFSDAMGDSSQNAETYLKMIRRNTETLVKGLTNSDLHE